MKVLIAEDDATSRVLLETMLRQWEFTPVVTCDGREALEAMQRPDAPRIAILDWNMPEMDGPEVCQRIQANSADNPPYLILLTARDDKGDIVVGLESGANDFISKPYNALELKARVDVGRRMVELQSEIISARDALAYQATHDPLTDTLNRRAILEELERELARSARTGAWLGVGVCDLDHFKRVNDVYGHQVGDEVLRGFVACVQKHIRKYDMLGRFGGEEFLLIAPESQDVVVEELFERARREVAENPMATRAGDIAITVSIGVAVSKGDLTADAVIARADAALYRAKAEGRNRVVYHEEE